MNSAVHDTKGVCARSIAVVILSKIAIYARVGTDKQDNENQLVQLREFAKQGWSLFAEYVDRESGAKSDRAEFQRMFADASKRKFDLVLFWAFRSSLAGKDLPLLYWNVAFLGESPDGSRRSSSDGNKNGPAEVAAHRAEGGVNRF